MGCARCLGLLWGFEVAGGHFGDPGHAGGLGEEEVGSVPAGLLLLSAPFSVT